MGTFTDDGTPGHGHFPLLPASRAINAGNDAVCPPTDQLGLPRVGICDIGAVEFPQVVMVVNDAVTFEPIRATFTFTPDPIACSDPFPVFIGTFSFQARLTNTSDGALTDLFVAVNTLTNGNLLQNADGGPAGAGTGLTVPQEGAFADGVLRPGEFVNVPFSLCLTQQQPFRFLVDVLTVVE